MPTFGGDKCCEGLTEEANGNCSAGREGKAAEEEEGATSGAAAVNGRHASEELQFILWVCGCQGLSKVGVAEGVFTSDVGVVPEPPIKLFGLVSGVGGTRFRTSGCCETASSPTFMTTLSVVGGIDGDIGDGVDVGAGVLVAVVFNPGFSCLPCKVFMDVVRHLLSDSSL